MAKAEFKSDPSDLDDDPQLVAGRYRLHDRIGSGRLGELFEATPEDPEDAGGARRLAVQIVPETIVRNNRLFNQLNVGYSKLRATAHPNLVGYLRFGRHGKCGYLAMELLDGVSLRQTLDEVRTLPMEEVKPIVRAVGEGLQLLHDEKMVHGDLTTGNVFITDGFGVRLLDVLPVDPSETIVRDRGSKHAFTRATERDDVFALASLAYEMLTGRRPFDERTRQEASAEGLEPAVIDSISDTEWKALRRALSFDRDQQTASVADFFREFGIRGTERLQQPADQTAGAPADDAGSGQSSQPLQSTESAATPAMFDSTVTPIPYPPRDSARSRVGPRPRRGLQTTILGLLLAALGSWFVFGQPREQLAELTAWIDAGARIDPLRSTESAASSEPPESGPAASDDGDDPIDGAAPIDAVAAGPAAIDAEVSSLESVTEGAGGDTSIPVDDPAVDATPAGDNVSTDPTPATAAQPASQATETETAAFADQAIGDEAQTSDAAATDSASNVEAATAPEIAAAQTGSEAESAPRSDEAIPTEPVVSFDASVVQISERDGIIRISAPATAPSGKPVVWWTSDGSAKSGLDFIGVEPQYVGDAPAETATSILIVPLVDDSLAEPREAFAVNFGVYDSARVDIDLIAALRVEVVDDDGL